MYNEPKLILIREGPGSFGGVEGLGHRSAGGAAPTGLQMLIDKQSDRILKSVQLFELQQFVFVIFSRN